MKAIFIAALMWQAAGANEPPMARPDAMRYERVIHVPGQTGQACAIFDGKIYSHAAPSLADLRIFPTGAAHEIPYAVTESEAVTDETQPARLLNLGRIDGKIAFDLEMPPRPYTEVKLQIDPAVENYLATATITGSNTLRGGIETSLGSFTLFDLAAQHLSRNTTVPLPESTFRYLHVIMTVVEAATGAAQSSARFAPAMVQAAEVPPSREAQILYTSVAETSSIATVGRESRAALELPVRVPVERISFVLAPRFKGNFSREVRVTAHTETGDDGDLRETLPETVSGTISRVHAVDAGTQIRSDQLALPAILGANLQRSAKVEVAVENGDDQPLPIAAIRLEMRQREVCFDAAQALGGELRLYYGDPGLAGPVYDYERLFSPSVKSLRAQLGPEMLNPSYRPPAEARTFVERHPGLLWAALLAVIGVLGLVALRSSSSVGRGDGSGTG